MPVGRADRDADREEREQRGDEVGARVQRLRDRPRLPDASPAPSLSAISAPAASDRDERRSPLRAHRERTLEVAAERLLALDRLEQRLEVALAEAAGAVALDHLEEERRPVLRRSS